MPWCALRLIPIAGLVLPRMTELGNHAIANISHSDTKRIVILFSFSLGYNFGCHFLVSVLFN